MAINYSNTKHLVGPGGKPVKPTKKEVETVTKLKRAIAPIEKRVAEFGKPPKVSVTLRLDADVEAHFRAGGPGYQSRINAYLRSALK